MGSWLADVRYALRGLLARPLFLATALLSLGLGIGVNTAIYSLFHQVVLRPLPVPQPQALVNLSAPGLKPGNTSSNNAGPREDIFSYPMFRDLERRQTTFAGLAAHRSMPVNVAYGDRSESGNAMLVSGAYFPVLGLQPALGRLLGPQDDGAIGASPVAVLSHAYWQNELGGASDVVGRGISVNGQPLTIVGVAPEGFGSTTFGARPRVYVPLVQRWMLAPNAPKEHEARTSYWLYLFGRLRDGVGLQQASAELDGIYGNLLREVEAPLNASLDENAMREFVSRRIVLEPGMRGQSSAASGAGKSLAVLLAAAALVLLVACLNIANLMLARGAARAGEIAVRASIGASRARLVRQLLVEALMIGFGGALASLPLAAASLSLLGALLPVQGASAFVLQIDAVATRFAFALGLGTVLLFGLFPAWQLARTAPIAALRGESGRSGGSRAASRFRSALAVAQVGLSMASLALAGLFLQSLDNLRNVDLGVDIAPVATFSISPERNGYSPERSAVLFGELERAFAALPGVTASSASMVPILTNNEWGSNISLQGFDEASAQDMTISHNSVGAGYFDALGMRVLAGRVFLESDGATAPKVAVVNRRFVERFGLGSDVIGRRLAFGDREELDIEIVGVVQDSKYADLRQPEPAQVFVPWRQTPPLGEINFYVRSGVDVAALLPQLRAKVAEFDPQLPVDDLQTVRQQLEQVLNIDRFIGVLAGAFALLATLLAALGLYGVLSYMLAQRMREIGLRLALGAAPQRLRRMVLVQVGRLTLFGGLLGLVAAIALGRAAQALLFGLSGSDPLALAAAAAVLAVVALSAGWLPARRAARIDPAVALRQE
jgi:predicted permease